MLEKAGRSSTDIRTSYCTQGALHINDLQIGEALSPAIIFDPVCGSSRGHNYKTTIKYADWLASETSTPVEIWIPKSDCDPSEATVPVKKNLPWVFEYFLPTKNGGIHTRLQRSARKLRALAPQSRLAKLILFPCQVFFHWRSVSEIRRAILRALKLEPSVLFFPGADFYSILALQQLADRGKISKNQKIILRLMGVMETAAHLPGIKNSYLHALQLLLNHNLRTMVTGETEKYSAHLERHIKIVVPVTHIPLDKKLLLATDGARQSADESGRITIACLGGARADKGYFEITDHAHRARLKWGRYVHFVIQGMSPENPEYDAEYELHLSRCLNVTVLPSYLDDDDLFSWIRRANAIFLPYSVGTYEQRGSAILFDTLPFGKMIIGRRGTGFGDTIDSYGLGATFEDWETLDRAFKTLVEKKPDYSQQIRSRQTKYLELVKNNLKEVFDAKEVVRIY
jgi:hypothetical protein